MSSGQERLVIADELNEIVSALLNRLINDVFSSKGLFGVTETQAEREREGSEFVTGNDLCEDYGICEGEEGGEEGEEGEEEGENGDGSGSGDGTGSADPLCVSNCIDQWCTTTVIDETFGIEVPVCDSPQLNSCINSCIGG